MLDEPRAAALQHVPASRNAFIIAAPENHRSREDPSKGQLPHCARIRPTNRPPISREDKLRQARRLQSMHAKSMSSCTTFPAYPLVCSHNLKRGRANLRPQVTPSHAPPRARKRAQLVTQTLFSLPHPTARRRYKVSIVRKCSTRLVIHGNEGRTVRLLTHKSAHNVWPARSSSQAHQDQN